MSIVQGHLVHQPGPYAAHAPTTWSGLHRGLERIVSRANPRLTSAFAAPIAVAAFGALTRFPTHARLHAAAQGELDHPQPLMSAMALGLLAGDRDLAQAIANDNAALSAVGALVAGAEMLTDAALDRGGINPRALYEAATGPNPIYGGQAYLFDTCGSLEGPILDKFPPGPVRNYVGRLVADLYTDVVAIPGREYTSSYTVDPRQRADYAAATVMDGDTAYKGLMASLLFSAALRPMIRALIAFILRAPRATVIHASEEITLLNRIPEGTELQVVVTVRRGRLNSDGTFLIVLDRTITNPRTAERTLVDPNPVIVAKATSFLIVGADLTGVTPSMAPGEFGTLRDEFTRTITDAEISAFRDASGDHQPIHESDELARALGLKGRIYHGMGVYGRALAVALRTAPTVSTNPTFVPFTFSGSFHSPVFVGDTLEFATAKDPKGRAVQVVLARNRAGHLIFEGRLSQVQQKPHTPTA